MTQTATPQAHLADAFCKARKGLVLAGVFSAFLNLLMLTTPIYMLLVFDRVLTTGHGDTLIALTLIVAVALAVLGVLEGVRLLLMSRTAAWVQARLGPGILAAGLKSSLKGSSNGSQAIRDASTLQGFLGSTGLNPFFDAPWTPVFVLFIFLLNPWLGVLALGTAALLLCLAVINDRASRPALALAGAAQMTATAKVDEAMRNAEVVQAMGMQQGLETQWRALTTEGATKQDSASRWMALSLGLSRFLRFGAQVGILGVGAALVITGDLSPGGMIAGSILLGRALAPVDQAINAWRGFGSAREAYNRLNAMLDENPADVDAMTLPAPEGHLLIERATFYHRNAEKPAVANISLVAAPGDLVALIGPSASGKSTLCRLAVGAWRPTSGHVRLDGADIANWPRREIGAYVGYLPQDVELFSGSIRDNISRLAEADPEDVVAAARLAGVHDMILQFPNGYDTQIGPLGTKLSGGQRQRIGLARALFGNPRLIVLDEPNANLDTAGDEALARVLIAAKASGATILIATHRRQLLSLATKVAMLEGGALRAFGPRDEVFSALEKHGIIKTGAKPATTSGTGNVTQLPRGDGS